MRKKDTKYEPAFSTMFSKRKPNRKSWRKITAEVWKEMVHRMGKGQEKDASFLRQPEELLRVQKPPRQGKCVLLLQYFVYIFFLL